MTRKAERPDNQPFTACPNGRSDRGFPHNFVGLVEGSVGTIEP